ncbi:hypothetical protein [Lysinibacillus sp. 54212]|uniref:hypothetical protein n=1 Tax=Lysinibacillus sp. 54212 TaxID=3119829 RepID=UPI002FCC8D4D
MAKWNPALYDEKHDFISRFGASLLEVLSPKANEVILNLGYLAHDISDYGAKALGIDASQEMIEQAQRIASLEC